MTAADYMQTDDYKAAVSLNWMVSIHIYRGKDKESVNAYASPWDCLDVALRLWTAIPDALSIGMSIPSLGKDGINWRFDDWRRNEKPRRRRAVAQVRS